MSANSARSECQTAAADVSWVRGPGAEPCPSAAEIRSEIERRIGKSIGAKGEGKSVEVTIEKTSSGWSARIVASGCGAERAVREVKSEAQTCEPIASAAALVIALAIDPQAALARPTEPDVPPGSPEARTPPVEVTPPPAPAAEAPPVVEAPPAAAPARARPPPLGADRQASPAAKPQPPPAVETRLTFGGAVAAGLLPVPSPGFVWSGEWRFSRWLAAGAGVLFLPEQPARNPTFAFGMTTAWAGACSDPLRSFGRIEAGLCGRVLAGTIHAAIHTNPSIIGTGPGQRAWAGGAAGGRVIARVAGPLVLEAAAEIVVPFTRYSFILRGVPEPVFLQAPLAGLLHFGAGLAFP